MELRQLRYFVRIVEAGSMSRAALELDVVQSALSQQVSRLEGELATRLLQRTPQGVTPTEAGLAFFHEAKLTLRHAEQAVRSAQQARLSGSVSIGLAPTTSALLGLPLMQAMRERYPEVRLHMVEGMSGHLAAMLRARELDLAILFGHRPDALALHEPASGAGRGWQVLPLMEEALFLIRSISQPALPPEVDIEALRTEPLILPTGPHGLRSAIDAAFDRAGIAPQVALEVDSLAMVMAAVDAGLGATLQPWAALGRYPDADRRFHHARLDAPVARRVNLLCSRADEELAPAVLAARGVMRDSVRALVEDGRWAGVTLV
ncbi:MAG: LysR family transcriptional regulator [Pseudacidovorax sp.]|uniref:LysR substrate-binding domain-containing protein n=1 Tax=Pseudacidovorax sp. TaxID=1934311 RepID=UPI001B65010A|nr:LysR substrate-binding domain-containing protein [Pseudacidovorax sp.]MBP6896780.1 LysR family transcriptional regulator [Pseudacidovorax sp.]